MKDTCPTCGQSVGPHTGSDPERTRRRIEEWLLKKLATTPHGLTDRELARAVNSRDRATMNVVKAALVESGIARLDDSRLILN